MLTKKSVVLSLLIVLCLTISTAWAGCCDKDKDTPKHAKEIEIMSLEDLSKKLELTADQKKQIKSINKRYAEKLKEQRAEAKEYREEIEEELDEDTVDLKELEEAMKEQAEHRVEMKIAGMSYLKSLKAVLTEDQIKKIKQFHTKHKAKACCTRKKGSSSY